MKNSFMNILIKKYHPDLYRKIKDKRQKLSTEVMSHRLKHNLDIYQISSILKITPEKYLKLEYGDLDISVREYNFFIKRLESLKKKKRG